MELGRLPEIIITFYIVSSLLIPPHSPLVVDKLPRLLDAQAPVGQDCDADDAGGYGGGDIAYMQKAGDSWDISPQFFLDFPQNFRLRTRNQYCTQAIA